LKVIDNIDSSSNYDSSHSGSAEGKKSVSKKLFLATEDVKAGLTCSGSPAKTSLAGLSPMVSLTCAHCRENFCLEDNRVRLQRVQRPVLIQSDQIGRIFA
jgi:hypothetical protein